MTHDQLSALAAWAGISYNGPIVDAHSWLFDHNHHCVKCDHTESVRIREPESEGPKFACAQCGYTGDTVVKHFLSKRCPDPTDPGADPREVDRVWLADVWHTLGKQWEFRTGPTHADNPNEACCARMKSSNLMDYAPSATLALLLAARAAGVPEAVEIMGDES